MQTRDWLFDTTALVAFFEGEDGIRFGSAFPFAGNHRFWYHPVTLAEIATQTNPDFWLTRSLSPPERIAKAKLRKRLLVLMLLQRPFPDEHGPTFRMVSLPDDYWARLASRRANTASKPIKFGSGRASPALADHQIMMSWEFTGVPVEEIMLVAKDVDMLRMAREWGIQACRPKEISTRR